MAGDEVNVTRSEVDERLAVMLNAILQLEAQGDCRESATESVLMVGYTSEGIPNQEQTRWLSWNVDGGVRERDKANLDRDVAKLERDQANLQRDQAVLERDQARGIRGLDAGL